MIQEQTKQLINEAVKVEYNSACNKYGKTYNSNHEAYSVLKEEIDEARDEFVHIQNNLFTLWQYVKCDNPNAINSKVKYIKTNATNLILEACQIVAVCNKILTND